jgi:enoyl-CoA hydratase
MAYETIVCEKRDRIAVVTLNRPPMNLLNRRMYEELTAVAEDCDNDPQVKVVVITGGEAKAFGAGLDVVDVEGKSLIEIMDFLACCGAAYAKIAAIGKPVIAAINGVALGGGLELALRCDLRIASEKALFGQPEVNLGIIPGGGATQYVSRLIGATRAKEIFYAGDTFTADKALALGLINRVVPHDRLMEDVMAVASSLAAKSAVALRMIKQSVDHGLNMDLGSALTYEKECFALSFVSEDGREGLRAFVEKRKPNYQDT